MSSNIQAYIVPPSSWILHHLYFRDCIAIVESVVYCEFLIARLVDSLACVPSVWGSIPSLINVVSIGWMLDISLISSSTCMYLHLRPSVWYSAYIQLEVYPESCSGNCRKHDTVGYFWLCIKHIHDTHTLNTYICIGWECMAKWIGYWTWDQKAWGSVPGTGRV